MSSSLEVEERREATCGLCGLCGVKVTNNGFLCENCQVKLA